MGCRSCENALAVCDRLRKIQMPWKGCAAIGLQALIAAIKALTPRMAMTRLRL